MLCTCCLDDQQARDKREIVPESTSLRCCVHVAWTICKQETNVSIALVVILGSEQTADLDGERWGQSGCMV